MMTALERARFDAKVRKGSTCWNWIGGHGSHGYGETYVGRKVVLAHRVAYEEVHGPIPKGFYICHRCDNRSCVNPDHLFLGTPQENENDCKAKRRRPHGSALPHAKLNEEQVREIKLLARKGVSVMELARRYNVAHGTIGPILRGKTWSRVVL